MAEKIKTTSTAVNDDDDAKFPKSAAAKKHLLGNLVRTTEPSMTTPGGTDVVWKSPVTEARQLLTLLHEADVQGTMHITCAWCGKDMGTKPGPHGKTSHSMCPACVAKYDK